MEAKREEGHQYTGCRKGVLEKNCARADVVSHNRKEKKCTVCMSWDDSALEDRFTF